MIAKAGSPLFSLIFPLLFTAALSSSPQSRLHPRLDHIPLGLPNLPPGLFITYTGVLTGSFQLDPSGFPFDAAQCAGGSGTYFFTDTVKSSVRIGVNPPSIDPNPIFFVVQQGGPDLPLPDPGLETGPPTTTEAPTGPTSPNPTHASYGLTRTPSLSLDRPTVMPVPIFSAAPEAVHAEPGGLDTRQAATHPVLPPGATHSGGIKNLLFASLYTTCTQDSRPCGTIRTAGPGAPAYHALRMLDLTSPGLLGPSADPSDPGGGASYALRGDQSTWAGNDTVEWSGLDFSPPANYTAAAAPGRPPEPEACTVFRYPPLVWNATTPFQYDLVFSNASATLTLTLAAPLGTVTLRVEGARRADGPDAGADAAAAAAAAAAADAIQVGAGAGGAPGWSFVNGTGFHFDGLAPVAKTSVAGGGGGLSDGEDGLESGVAGAWAGSGGGAGVALALALAFAFAAMLL